MQDPKFFSKLQKGRQAKGITARVVRKWVVYDSLTDSVPQHVGLVLADGKGDSMYAQIPRVLIEKKAYLFEIGNVYIIKKFVVDDSRTSFKAVDKKLMIEITDYTSAELVQHPPSTIPQYIYTITPFSAIKVSQFVQKYTDVIGYIVKYEALHTFVQKNTEKTKVLREIYIKDLRENIMKITLWGEQAASFSLDGVYDKETGNIIVCLIVGCIPRHDFRNNDKIVLSGSPACSYYFNPQIPEAVPFHTRFKDTPLYIEEPQADQDQSVGQPQKVILPQKTVAQLEDVDPFDEEEPGPYKCMVTVTSIVNSNRWWYMSCKRCKKKVEQQMNRTYRCPNSRCQETATVPRYTLTFIGSDDTGEAQFFAYDDEAQKMIQKECESVLALSKPDGDLPQPIRNLIGKTYIFSVDLTNDSCRMTNKRQYQIKAILQRPTNRLHTETISGSGPPLLLGSSSTKVIEQTQMPSASKSLTENQTLAATPAKSADSTPMSLAEDDVHGYKDSSVSKGRGTAKKSLQQSFDSAKKIDDAAKKETTSSVVVEDNPRPEKKLKQMSGSQDTTAEAAK